MKPIAKIKLWGKTIGAANINERGLCSFEYTSAFQNSDIQISPLMMPLSAEVYQFPELSRETFHGLPGLLADALPDKFGNALIDAWLASQGRMPASLNAIERLCYTGSRGMGALEFEPANHPISDQTHTLQVDQLVKLASSVLQNRNSLHAQLKKGENNTTDLSDILRVGTSAGGARAKAVIAWNPKTHKIKSGQVDTASGFEHWLLKFDGVSANKDKELDDPKGYTVIEFAYSEMARAAGIWMMPCLLMEENDRRHFLTKRFDRDKKGKKIHMQSLCAMAHYDFNIPGAYSYEQCFFIMRQLNMSMLEREQQFRRMALNVIARNQDDHVKNIAFLMDQQGNWTLSPAYDITYSYNPTGRWTSNHQMTIAGKQDHFTLDDFEKCAHSAMLKRGRAKTIIKEITEIVSQWPTFAKDAGINNQWIKKIQKTHRLQWR